MIKKLFCILLLITMINSAIVAQHYKHVEYFNSGGGHAASQFLRMDQSLGDVMIGNATSSRYRQTIGGALFLKRGGGGGPMPFQLAVNQGWNMVSVPFNVPDFRKTSIFPTASSSAFMFNGGYNQVDTLKNKKGYWLKFSNTTLVPFNGTPRQIDTFDVSNNWNLIGSIGMPIQTNQIVEIPDSIITSSFFGYNDGYYQTDHIQPGNAYWVKINNGGKLSLKAMPPPSANIEKETLQSEKELLSELNVLTVQKKSLKKRATTSDVKSLYFGESQNTIQDGRFELPPTPPDGAMDVRFGTNKFVEVVSNDLSEPKIIPIRCQSGDEPLVFNWTMKKDNQLKYVLVEKSGKNSISEHRLRESGSITIVPSENKKLELRIEQIPVTFKLYQNYPNPFNPNTTIRFDMPEPASVNLSIFNILGQEVAQPIQHQLLDEGQQDLQFDANNLPSGTYFYRIVMNAGNKTFQDMKKFILIK